VNLVARTIEVYTEPSGPARKPDYRKRVDYTAGDRVPILLDGNEVGTLALGIFCPVNLAR